MIKILELFGGIGSPRCALRNMNIPTKAIDYVEIDQKAVKSYNEMFRNELEYTTQSVVGYNLKPDILIHGSPCQDFSIAGKQQGADKGTRTRSSLMWETIEIVRAMGEWKPKYIIWENVKNVLSKHMRHNFDDYIQELQKLGYTSNFAVLNTMDFGIPQNRNRVFTVSCLNGQLFNFDLLRKSPTKDIKEFLVTEFEDYYKVTQPSMLSKINGTDNSNFNGKVKIIDKYCETITTKQVRCPNAGVIEYEPKKYRYLTELECWRLQGYRDSDYYAALKANPSQKGKMNGALYKQAGNSISVPIFESLFELIFEMEGLNAEIKS